MLNSLDLEGRPQDTRVVVAMSGGVDLVGDRCAAEGRGLRRRRRHAAALRSRRGGPSQGRLLRRPGHPRCARKVAERIGIPHYVLDYEARFKEAVIDRFAESYVAGETPVPCVACNQSIKFRDLLDTAQSNSARRCHGDRPLRRVARAARRRPRAVPRARGRARPELFPVRHHARATRHAALSARRPDQGGDARACARFGLAVADKHDSQDICFVPTGRYTDVIERLKPGAAEPGEIVDLDGQVLGRHDGIIHFTVGQRRGLGIATGAPLYVVRLDARRAARCGRPARGACGPAASLLREVNWIGGGALDEALAASAQDSVRESALDLARHRPAWLQQRRPGLSRSNLIDSEEGVSPGQACVFYDARGRSGACAWRRIYPQHGCALAYQWTENSTVALPAAE